MASILDTIGRPDLSVQKRARMHPSERIRKHTEVIPESGCHEWRGRVSSAGYGVITVVQSGYQTRTFSAHKAAFELSRGRVPEGMVLDHLCRNRICVNPDHLEVVTQRENVMRSPIAPGALNAAKTHCAQGHEFTPENTYLYQQKPPRTSLVRICRSCRNAQRRSWLDRKAAVR